MDATERMKRLRRMLEQVGAAEHSGGLRSQLESAVESPEAGPDGGMLESLPPRPVGQPGAEAALETLDSYVQNQQVDEKSRGALEAIVMPYHRPVVDIIGNTIKLSHLSQQWSHLGEGPRRVQIESTFRSVGRVEVPGQQQRPYVGTAFVVGTRNGNSLLMTNRHVAEIFTKGLGVRNLQFHPGSAEVDFLREKGRSEREVLGVERVLMIHPYWDMALLEVSGLHSDHRPLTLSTAEPMEYEDSEVVAVGYPGYDWKPDPDLQELQRTVFRGAIGVKRLQPGQLRVYEDINSYDQTVKALTHDCSTLGGNSGSAVFLLPKAGSDPLQVTGLHFQGAYLHANYAVPCRDLATDSRVVDMGVNFAGDLEPRGDFYGPFWSEAEPEVPAEDKPATSGFTSVRAAGRGTPTVRGGTMTWTIPLQVSVSLGTPQPTAATMTPAASEDLREGLFGRRTPRSSPETAARFSRDSLSATGFTWSTALSLVLASQLSYRNASVVETTAKTDWKLSTCKFLEAEATQCFIASSADVVLIAFRGTESLGDWLGNLNTFPKSRPYGTVHRGFYFAFQDVRPQLEDELREFAGRSLLLTGHSLGGALATIAAAEWQGGYSIKGIYTYGQPAVGRGQFLRFMGEHYGDQFFRFVNDDDIVPRVPPNFWHVGQLYHFDSRGRLKAQRESLGTTTESDGPPMLSEAEFNQLRGQLLMEQAQMQSGAQTEAVAAPELEGFFPSVRDHRLDEYIANIAAMVR